MFRLNRRFRAVTATRDRGAIAILTAVLLSGALIAFAAIAVDVGAAFDEHRQLRNGADATALAVARSCAVSTCDASTSASSTNGQIANGNAVDGTTTIDLICGTAPGLDACPPPPVGGTQLSTCLSSAPSTRYVEVRTRTRTKEGGSTLQPIFADHGTTVTACARATYGTPKALVSGLPITISKCWLADYTSTHGGSFAPSPPYSPNASSFGSWETVVVLHQNSNDCAVSSAGKNAPGNFGYIDDGGAGPCQAYTAVNTTVGGDTGNSVPQGCSDSYLASLLDTVVYLPVFDPDATTGSGNNVEYQVVGYAAFYFTGWSLTSTSHASTVTGAVPCDKSETCISGFFVRGLLPTPGPIDPTVDSALYGASSETLLS